MRVSKSHQQLVNEALKYSWKKKNIKHKNQAGFSAFSHLSSPTDVDYDSLASLMHHGGSVIKADPNELAQFNKDWTGHYKGISNTVVQPTCVEEVSSILAYCNERSIGVVPQGGNTGLVGGSVPVSDEIVLSLSLMNKIYPSLNGSNDADDSSILTCDAGCILQSLQDYASERNYLIPIDIGSKGSCMIGGNISTNAGGQYFNRFGSLHANVVGLEVVLADGRVLDLLNRNRKDNTGYHLKHLFIGAEGTLGVVTKVNLYCPLKPSARNVALVACETFQHVIDSLKLAKAQLGEILAAFEFMDQNALDLSESSVPFGKPNNGNNNYPFCVLIETQGSNMEYDTSKLLKFLEQSIQEGVVIDGILAQDGKQIQRIWEIRESINPKISKKGYTYKYDASFPRLLDFHEIVLEMNTRLLSNGYNNPQQQQAKIVTFGHVADGNLHFNVVTPGNFFKDDDLLNNVLEPYLFHSVIRRNGSISAEHGIGRAKRQYLPLVKSKETLEMMRSIKLLLDPKGILNPGKVL